MAPEADATETTEPEELPAPGRRTPPPPPVQGYGQGATPRGIVVDGKFKNPNTQALLKSLQPY